MVRKARARANPFYWVQVRIGLYCALGGHQVQGGEWVRVMRGVQHNATSCEACLLKVGIQKPARPFVFRGEGSDIKHRQVGE